MFLFLPMTGINIATFTRSHNTFVLQNQKFGILRSESLQELLVIVSKGKVSWNINSSLIKILIAIMTPVLHWGVKSQGHWDVQVLFQPKESPASKKNVGLFLSKLSQGFYVLQTFKASKSLKVWVLKFFDCHICK